MKISVFITSYNQKAFLIEAIESVLKQTLLPFQIIIVDDCSKDGSQEVIAGYASQYKNLIKPIFHQKNTGIARVRIDALNAVTGNYVTYVDGDDRFLPTKLEKEANLLLKKPNAQIAFSNNYYMTEEGVHTGIWADKETPPEGNVFCQTFARDFPRHNLFRMELIEFCSLKKVGFHDTKLDIYEDYDLRIRLSKNLQTAYYDEPLSEIRLHDKGLSCAPFYKHLQSLEYVYKKNKSLLNDLSFKEKAYIKKNLNPWTAKIAINSAYYILNNHTPCLKEKKRALSFFLKALAYYPMAFDLKLILKVFSLGCRRCK